LLEFQRKAEIQTPIFCISTHPLPRNSYPREQVEQEEAEQVVQLEEELLPEELLTPKVAKVFSTSLLSHRGHFVSFSEEEIPFKSSNFSPHSLQR